MTFTTLAPPTEALDPSHLGFEIGAGRSVLSRDPCDDLTSWHARLYVPGWLSNELRPEQFPNGGTRDDKAPNAVGPGRVEDHIVATVRVVTLIAALALDTVGADARLFACSPGAFELKHGTSERASADRRLVELWTKFGFTIPHRHLLLADPAATDWSAVVRELCEEEE